MSNRIKNWKEYTKVNELYADTVKSAINKIRDRGQEERADHMSKLATEIPYNYDLDFDTLKNILLNKDIGVNKNNNLTYFVHNITFLNNGARNMHNTVNLPDLHKNETRNTMQVVFDLKYKDSNKTYSDIVFAAITYDVAQDNLKITDPAFTFTEEGARLMQEFIKEINPESKYANSIDNMPIK